MLNLIPNLDALTVSIATALATVIVLGLKALFSLARRLAQKTPTALDDKLVDNTETALRDKSREI